MAYRHDFDLWVIGFLNQFSQRSHLLDESVEFLSGCNLLKGGVIIALLWWVWFKNEPHQARVREHVTATLVGCIIAMVVARAVAIATPLRLRPLHEESLNFLLPFGMEPRTMDGWSSFPSDHAALFFALSFGLLFASKRIGAIALAHTFIFIAIPRMYLGLHYPTDILAGAAIGATAAVVANVYLVRQNAISPISRWATSKPEIFYPLFFVFSYQIADLFTSVRSLAAASAFIVRGLIA